MNETYAGVWYGNRTKTVEDELGRKRKVKVPHKEWQPVPVTAIVSREQWERCQEKLRRGKVSFERAHTKRDYLIARLVTCRTCESGVHATTARSRNKEFMYYKR
jgi:site-specific DNA recombinase